MSEISQMTYTKERYNYLIFFFSIVLTISVFYLIGQKISLISLNVSDISIDQINTIFNPGSFAPEPVEKRIFLLGILFIPLMLLFSFRFFSILLVRLSPQKMSLTYWSAILSSIALFSFLFRIYRNSGQLFYLDINFGSSLNILFSITIFPLSLLVIYAFSRRSKFAKLNRFLCTYSTGIEKLLNFVFYLSFFSVLTIVFLMNLSSVYNQSESPPHLNAVIYSITQVFNGKYLLLDFNNQYGLYPHFLKPIFKLIGLNVLKYSFVMQSIIVISYLSIFLLLKDLLKGRLLQIFGLLAFVSWAYFYMRAIIFKGAPLPYYQYYALRMIFPCLYLNLLWKYLCSKKDKYYYSIAFLSSLSIFWNLDTGIIIFISWILVLGYEDLQTNDLKSSAIRALRGFGLSISIFLVLLIAWGLNVYAYTGKILNIFEYVKYQGLFYDLGLMMIKMKTFQPWNLVILIYILGICLSYRNLFNRIDNPVDSFSFALSIFGTGIFVYFQGRSHPLNLYTISYPAIILLLVYFQSQYNFIKKNGWKYFHHTIHFIVLFYILLSPTFSIFSQGTFFKQWISFGINSFKKVGPDLEKKISFIRKNTQENEKIAIISPNFEGIYFAETGRRDAIDLPSSTELYLGSDFKKKIQFLKNNKTIKVFYEVTYQTANLYIYRRPKVIKELASVLSSYKTIKQTDNGLKLLMPNR